MSGSLKAGHTHNKGAKEGDAICNQVSNGYTPDEEVIYKKSFFYLLKMS
jgi:hypothetical protein